MSEFNISTFDVKEFDRILACGLSNGLGKRGDKVCIEAAICQVIGLKHGDDPGCVTESIRQFKMRLNDSRWSSPKARAAGLHDLGLAQLGSKGVVSDKDFSQRIAEKTIRVLIPTLFREMFKDKPDCLVAADKCEKEGTSESARNAYKIIRKYNAAAYAAAYAANAAAAAYAAAAAAADKYLNLSAKLALEALRELNSPGVALLK